MLISIRTLQGQEKSLEVQPTDTVLSVKYKIQPILNIRADLQRLVFEEISLENNRTLASYGIAQHSILNLILRKCLVGIHLLARKHQTDRK